MEGFVKSKMASLTSRNYLDYSSWHERQLLGSKGLKPSKSSVKLPPMKAGFIAQSVESIGNKTGQKRLCFLGSPKRSVIIRTNKTKQDSYPATLAYSSTEKALGRSNVETIDWNLEPRKGDATNDGLKFSEKETSKTKSQVVGTPQDREDSNFTFAQRSK